METKPLSDKISAASTTVSVGKDEERESRERMMREMNTVEAIDGNLGASQNFDAEMKWRVIKLWKLGGFVLAGIVDTWRVLIP